MCNQKPNREKQLKTARKKQNFISIFEPIYTLVIEKVKNGKGISLEKGPKMLVSSCKALCDMKTRLISAIKAGKRKARCLIPVL